MAIFLATYSCSWPSAVKSFRLISSHAVLPKIVSARHMEKNRQIIIQRHIRLIHTQARHKKTQKRSCTHYYMTYRCGRGNPSTPRTIAPHRRDLLDVQLQQTTKAAPSNRRPSIWSAAKSVCEERDLEVVRCHQSGPWFARSGASFSMQIFGGGGLDGLRREPVGDTSESIPLSDGQRHQYNHRYGVAGGGNSHPATSRKNIEDTGQGATSLKDKHLHLQVRKKKFKLFPTSF